MDEIKIVGTSKANNREMLKFPSVRNSRKKFLNLSQNIITDFSEDGLDKKNLSFNTDLFEPLDSARGLKKIISMKKNNFDIDEVVLNKDNQKPSSPGLGIKGVITPTHARILKPIVKKPSIPLGVAKKRKPLKLIGKLLPQISLKQEIFLH